ncbi:hypothetical protein CRH02_22830 [Escherichia albertii]|nr:hypothetical protein CRH02_22830 [Escherichia albertii]
MRLSGGCSDNSSPCPGKTNISGACLDKPLVFVDFPIRKSLENLHISVAPAIRTLCFLLCATSKKPQTSLMQSTIYRL